MAKFIVGIILLLGVLFIINHFTEVEDVLSVLRNSDWRFFGAAIFLEGLWIVCNAATYHAVFDALGVHRRLSPLIPLASAANFVSVVAPSMGMSGMVVLISDARRNKFPSAHATVAGALFVLAEWTGFLIFLVLGLIVMVRRSTLNAATLISSAILFLMAIILATSLYLGMRSAPSLGRFLRWLAHQLNRILHPFIRREYLSEDSAERFALDAGEGLRELHNDLRKFLPPFFFAMASKAILVVVLMLMFVAFRVPLSPGTLFASFAIAYLFVIVSPTPAGIGIVEGALTLALAGMFVPLDQATVVTLGFRAITFWLPLLFGMVSFNLLHLKKTAPPIPG